MRKVGEYLGLVEQADYDDFDLEFEDEGGPALEPARREPARQAPVRPAPVANIEDRRSERRERRVPTPTASAPSTTDLARIETVTPRTYNDARTVGEHFRAGVPVIMNLSEIDEDDAKRLVDFAAGLIFAVHGTINRVTAKVFLLSPANVTVSDEDKQRLASGGFYNQS
jgi:cell division inhibitor SepF